MKRITWKYKESQDSTVVKKRRIRLYCACDHKYDSSIKNLKIIPYVNMCPKCGYHLWTFSKNIRTIMGTKIT